MRYLLTGDEFSAQEAWRIGLVQEVVETGRQLDRALELAATVAEQAPLGVQATIESAREAVEEGPDVAAQGLLPKIIELMQTEDAAEGVRSFLERRTAQFKGQ